MVSSSSIHSTPVNCNCLPILPLKISSDKISLFFVEAVYLSLLATIAAFSGQHIVRKLIAKCILIIFILVVTIFMSAICLGNYEHDSGYAVKVMTQ